MAHLSLHLFGSFRAVLDGVPLTTFSTDKGRALLAYLAVEAHQPHHRERLAGLFWADQTEKKALHSLRQALSSLRKLLGEEGDGRSRHDPCPPILLITQESVQFNLAADPWVDVRAFAAHWQAVSPRTGTAVSCNIRQLQQALHLFTAPLLDQFYLNDCPLFDEWLMLRREALNQQALAALERLMTYHEQRREYVLAQQAAARQVHLAPWVESAHRHLMRFLALDGQWQAAQAQFFTCRRYLTEQLGVEPSPETVTLYHTIRTAAAQNTPLPPRFAPPRHNLPPHFTPFVGRETELDEIAASLASPTSHLLTLLGPGGIGKTRLALQAATEQVGLFVDGVHFVPLAAVSRPDLLASAIATALHFALYSAADPAVQLYHYLRQKHLLLVLDNFEQLLGEGQETAVDLLITILQQAPGVKLLVTSRAPLNLQAERVLTLAGLPYPAQSTPLSLAPAAVQLFTQTARWTHPDFSLETEWTAVTDICRLLDGLPLGLELSAVWVRHHTCADIARQIVTNLDFLRTTRRDVPERHRSLRAVFRHSWELLAADEQRLFARLAVFRGGFMVDAACRVTDAAASQLLSLADKSLLRRVAANRYDLHGLLQQFAAEHLAEDALTATQTHRQHSQHFADFLAGLTMALSGPEPAKALLAIETEIENIRAGWQWAVTQANAHIVGCYLPVLRRFYEMRSWFREAQTAFTAAAIALRTLTAQTAVSQRVLGLVLAFLGQFTWRLGQMTEARELLQESLARLSELDAPRETAVAHAILGDILFDLGDMMAAQQQYQAGLDLGDDAAATVASLHNGLGDVHRVLGDFVAAHSHYQTVLDIYTAQSDSWGLARAYNNLGILSGTLGDYAAAETHFQHSRETFRVIDDRSGTARGLHNLSILAYLRRDYAQTKALRQECLAICREIGFQWGITSTLKHLGDVEKAMGELAAAQQHYQESLTHSRQAEDRKSAVYVLDSLADLSRQQQNRVAAWGYYREALETAVAIGLIPVAIDVLVGMAELFAEEGQIGQAVQLLAFAQCQPTVDQQTRDKAAQLLNSLTVTWSVPEVDAYRQQAQQQDLIALIGSICRDSTNLV